MKNQTAKLTHEGKEYTIAFNLNVMEAIQEEYGTLDKWSELTDGEHGEPNFKALKFGICAMMNEGVDIENEENGTDTPFFTEKQVGRLIWNLGLENVAHAMNSLVIESTKSEEKNE